MGSWKSIYIIVMIIILLQELILYWTTGFCLVIFRMEDESCSDIPIHSFTFGHDKRSIDGFLYRTSKLINGDLFQGLKELTEALLSENSNGFKNNGNVENLADARRRLVRYD